MRSLSALAVTLLAATPLAAQDPAAPRPGAPELVDRVVAVVGDTVLLLSDVQFELQRLQAEGRPLPDDPRQREELAQQVMESRINDLLLLEAAEAAGVTVSNEQVNEQVETEIRSVRQRFGNNEQALQAALERSGRTLDQYRQELAAQVRSRETIQGFVAQRLRNRARPLISESDIQEMFETQRDRLGTRPTTVSLQQVIVAPQPTDSARAAARREAEDVLKQLQEGGDFEVLARRFSDDPGSGAQGGDLGWFRAGRMVPEFEAVAFALRPGQTSGIVETDFGYHIIRVEKVRGPERQARHILIRPELTEADRQLARTRADSVATAIRGGANAIELGRRYDTPATEIEVARVPLPDLPPAYAAALQSSATGEVVGPIELQGPDGASWSVVKVMERAEAGAYTLDDLRDQIRERLQQQALVEQLVKDLRDEIYVSVRG